MCCLYQNKQTVYMLCVYQNKQSMAQAVSRQRHTAEAPVYLQAIAVKTGGAKVLVLAPRFPVSMMPCMLSRTLCDTCRCQHVQ